MKGKTRLNKHIKKTGSVLGTTMESFRNYCAGFIINERK